jgi:hypothetical protein
MTGMMDVHREKIKHGYANTPIYKSWHGMKSRCQNPNHSSYYKYGGRGIKVCDKWETFPPFLEDMGKRPKGYSLDRIDNDGDYTPENCKWSTPKEQARNGRHNRFYTIDGITKSRPEWCEIYGMNVSTFRHRVRIGWDVKDALMTPPAKAGRNVS